MMRLVKYSVDVKGLAPRMNTIDVGSIKSDEKSTNEFNTGVSTAPYAIPGNETSGGKNHLPNMSGVTLTMGKIVLWLG